MCKPKQLISQGKINDAGRDEMCSSEQQLGRFRSRETLTVKVSRRSEISLAHQRQGVGWGSVEVQGPRRQTGKDTDQLSIYFCLKGWQLTESRKIMKNPKASCQEGSLCGCSVG